MLFDPKWNKTADPFKLDTLIAWLEKRDPFGSYQYGDYCQCMLSRYFTDHGYVGVHMGQDDFMSYGSTGSKFLRALPNHFDYVARGPVPVPSHDTYGNALKRARECALRDRP